MKGPRGGNARPNLLIIKTDQQRFDTLGCMGHPVVRTPRLDALAEDGVRCTEAFCVSPLCVPSRTSFFTGDYVHRTGAVGNRAEHHIRAATGCLLDRFKERGYTLALAGKNHAFHDDYLESRFSFVEEYGHHGKTKGDLRPSDRALSDWYRVDDRFPEYGRQPFLTEGFIPGPLPFAEAETMPRRIAEDAVRFLDEIRDDPFVLHLSFPDPHWPNVVCEPWHSMYDPAALPPLEGSAMDWKGHPFAHWVQSLAYDFHRYDDGTVKKILATYYAQISFVDACVGSVLDRLKSQGIYDDTMIVFASDHGDFAGRYRLVAKTKGFYDSLTRIPLLMKMPVSADFPRGKKTVDALISNIDVMPTVLEALGMDSGPADGRSFLACLDGRTEAHRDAVFAEVGGFEPPPPVMEETDFLAHQERQRKAKGIFWFIEYTTRGRAAMIRADGWKYCFYTGDAEELYDLTSDPLEMRNLAKDPTHAERRRELQRRLMEWLLAGAARD